MAGARRPVPLLTGAISVAMAMAAGCSTGNRGAPGAPGDLVDVGGAVAGIVLDIRYATTSNFTGRKLYPRARCLLRRSTAEKLAAVQAELAGSDLGVKVFDCYRPLSVQRAMWEIVPDARYVADPAEGSRHNRGAAVDLTLVRLADGAELEMPTAYDDFSERAHRDWAGASPEQRANRALLERVMSRHGFVGLPTEWWHFDDVDWPSHPLLDVPFDEVIASHR